MEVSLNSVTARHAAADANAKAALRAISLRVRSGEQLAIIGPSGAGKTSLLHLLACALRPTSGEVLLGGTNPWALATRDLQRLRARLFLAPQTPPLPPRQRVVTAVLAGRLPHERFLRSLRSLFYPVDIALAERSLAAFGLSDKLFERVDRLSGGERQRVGLARLVAAQAQLFLIDEPLSALDPSRAAQATEALAALARARGATLVTSLHHVEMALRYFPRIIGLREGTIAFDLPAASVTPELLQDLYRQHLHELHGGAASADATPVPAAPAAAVAMHCR